jgi:uncharacterized protein (DUF58 family)
MAEQGLYRLTDFAEVDRLDWLAAQVVEGFIIGLHKSPFHGFSVEFAEHRLYNPGESTRHIDWKVFARTERLFTKRFEEETNLRCQIVLDCSSSMFFPEGDELKKRGGVNKARFSAVCAAAILHLMRKQRDAVGLSLFDDEIREHTRARSSAVHHKYLLSQIQQMLDQGGRGKNTSAAKALHLIAESTHRRSLVIVFSDLFERSDRDEELYSALQHLRHAKHEVVLFHVVDKSRELEFAFDNRPYRFVDLESGEEVKLRASGVREQYQEKVKAFQKELALRCGQYRIDYVEADAALDFKQVLLPYLVKRMRLN